MERASTLPEKKGVYDLEICHVTSVHPRTDTRVLLKMCRYLAQADHNVRLVVGDGKPDEMLHGCQIHGVRSFPRMYRILFGVWIVGFAAFRRKADVYHFHDPELMFVALVFSLLGRKTVFDFHEDVEGQILEKPYLRPVIARILSQVYRTIEMFSSRFFSQVICATPKISDKFAFLKRPGIVVQNYPDISEFASMPPNVIRKQQFCYVGGISRIRGILTILDALDYLSDDAVFALCGSFGDKGFEEEVRNHRNWHKVNFRGQISRETLVDIVSNSVCGLVLFAPVPNHIDSQPNKLFEYMACATPVVGSDFNLWRLIVNDNSCGTLVNPENAKHVAQAIQDYLDDPERVEQDGDNGREAVFQKYTWQTEFKILTDVYAKIGQ